MKIDYIIFCVYQFKNKQNSFISQNGLASISRYLNNISQIDRSVNYQYALLLIQTL